MTTRPPKSYKSLLEAAADALLALPPEEAYAAITREPLFVFTSPKMIEGVPLASRFATGKALFSAVEKRTKDVLFFALELLARADRAAAAPLVQAAIALRPPNQRDLFECVAAESIQRAIGSMKKALGPEAELAEVERSIATSQSIAGEQEDILAAAPLDTIVRLAPRLVLSPPTLVKKILRRKDLKAAGARLALAQRLAEAGATSKGSLAIDLRDALGEALAKVNDPAFLAFIRAADADKAHPLRAWARSFRRDLERAEVAREDVAKLKEKGATPGDTAAAIRSAFDLGPEAAADELLPRFFSERAIANKKGAKKARDVVHLMADLVLAGEFPDSDARWIGLCLDLVDHPVIGVEAREALDRMDQAAVKRAIKARAPKGKR